MEFDLNNKPRQSWFLLFLLLYAAVYGSFVVLYDFTAVRILKDFILLVVILLSILSISLQKKIPKDDVQILGMLLLFAFISFASFTSHGSLVLLVYGFKITVFPMFLILTGLVIKRKHFSIFEPTIVVFFLSIITWILQNIVGLDYLLALGFEYGSDVTNYVDGSLRLPSIAGAPDSYAFLLVITGIISELYLLYFGKGKISWVIKILTFVFLILGTIRSPLVLWLVFQALFFFQMLLMDQRRILYLKISLMLVGIAVVPFFLISIVNNSNIFDTRSLQARFSRWFEGLPNLFSFEGLFGKGLGMMGAASQRAYELGFYSLDYANDNQYFAIYGQLGIIGLVVFVFLLLMLLVKIRKTYKYSVEKEQEGILQVGSISLLVGTMISSFFTNNLEIYPFNVFLWLFLGMQLTTTQPLSKMKEKGSLRKSVIRFSDK